MDTTDQKLTQALEREVHLQMSLDAERRCNESLRAERDQLKQAVDFLSKVAAELTIAKQETGNALFELQSAVAVIEYYRNRWSEGPEVASGWLIRRYQQITALPPKAPVSDPELETPHVED